MKSASPSGSLPAVAFVCNSALRFRRVRAFADRVAEQCGRQTLVLATHPVEPERCIALYEGYRGAVHDLATSARLVREEFGIDPAILYVSDQEYHRNSVSECEMAARCLHVLRRLREIMVQHRVGHVFMPGGGTMITNAAFEYAARQPGVQCYRIHPAHFLDTDRTRPRYFFTDNNRHRIPMVDPPMLDRGKRQEAEAVARAYVEAVRTGSFKPDEKARRNAARKLFTPGVDGMLKAASRYALARFKGAVRGYDVPNIDRERVQLFWRKTYSDLTRRPLQLDGEFFLYVCHHPLDSQLLLRARQFRDQIALCRLIASSLPSGTRLLVKEHPVYPGMLPVSDVRRLTSTYPNVQFVDYSHSFRELVTRCKAVLTINSTAGLEAAILGIPVVTFGDSIYGDSRFVRRIRDFSGLTETLRQVLTDPPEVQPQDVANLLAEVLVSTVTASSFEEDAIVSAIAEGASTRVNAGAVGVRSKEAT